MNVSSTAAPPPFCATWCVVLIPKALCNVLLQGLRAYQVTEVAESFREIEAGGDGCVSFWEWAK